MAEFKSLKPDRNRWWRVAINMGDSSSVIDKETKKFYKNLEVIFDGANSGITASVILSFLFKASTDSRESLRPTTGATIAVVLERAYLEDTDVIVQMPVGLNTKKQKVDPFATAENIASDN